MTILSLDKKVGIQIYQLQIFWISSQLQQHLQFLNFSLMLTQAYQHCSNFIFKWSLQVLSLQTLLIGIFRFSRSDYCTIFETFSILIFSFLCIPKLPYFQMFWVLWAINSTSHIPPLISELITKIWVRAGIKCLDSTWKKDKSYNSFAYNCN